MANGPMLMSTGSKAGKGMTVSGIGRFDWLFGVMRPGQHGSQGGPRRFQAVSRLFPVRIGPRPVPLLHRLEAGTARDAASPQAGFLNATNEISVTHASR